MRWRIQRHNNLLYNLLICMGTREETAGKESDEHHCTLFPFLTYPFVLVTYILGIWYHWFIPESYDDQLSSKRLQAQTVALSSAFTLLLYFSRFTTTKLLEPGCFTNLTVKITR